MPESNVPEIIKYLTEDNLKLMYSRLNRRYLVVDALPSVDSLEPADKNVIYVVKETVGETVCYWPNAIDGDEWKPVGIGQDELDGKLDRVNAPEGHLVVSDGNGDLVDSGVAAASLTNKVAADGGTDLSLVTTGEKYVWNDWTSASVDIPPINGVKIGGRKYEVKKFGDRVWMMESLKYDTDVSEAVHINNGIYYYKNEYVFTNAEFAALLPAGWRVPTQADREAFIQNAGGSNVTGANYVKNNFNVEPSGMYNGYGTYPGSFSSYPFYIMTDGNSGSYAGAIYLTSDTPSELRNSGNAGGNDNQISAPVRLCRDVLQGE